MATADSDRFLLDTHAFLWLASDPERVPGAVRERLADPGAELWLSAASVWEMAIKRSLGKLTTILPLAELVSLQSEAMAVSILDIRSAHALAVESLPFHHRDPFDRLLVAQALFEDLHLVSADETFDLYPVDRVW